MFAFMYVRMYVCLCMYIHLDEWKFCFPPKKVNKKIKNKKGTMENRILLGEIERESERGTRSRREKGVTET